MAKYLWQVSYTTQGVQGVVKEGGSSRRAMVSDLVAGLGGTLEAFYYAFGDDDVYVIAELPDNVTAAAVSLAVGASGGARLKTVALVTPEEIDAATKKAVAYRPPGA
jgi:uncharacterized protein with GYD domain